MIRNLLLQEGIDGRVEGEYLQGGVGDLQAINLVRVVVNEADYDRARSIVSEWEAAQPRGAGKEASSGKRSTTGLGFFLGLAAGIGITLWAYNSPVTTNGIDYDGDGELDETWIYRDGRITRAEVDRNKDRKPDLITEYNRKGIIFRAKQDDDFDGEFETVFKYRDGDAYRQESDLNRDGKTDYRASLAHGVLAEVEILDPTSDVVRKKQQYVGGKLFSAFIDIDGNGRFDLYHEYDFFEEVKSTSSPID